MLWRSSRKITHFTQLGGKMIPWANSWLGLWQQGGNGLNAGICQKCPPKISSPSTKEATGSTTSPFSDKVWSQKTVCGTRRYLTTGEWGGIIHEVVGTFLYYDCIADYTMLASLRSIATQQANLTEITMKKQNNFWIMQQLTPIQSPPTEQAIWF